MTQMMAHAEFCGTDAVKLPVRFAVSTNAKEVLPVTITLLSGHGTHLDIDMSREDANRLIEWLGEMVDEKLPGGNKP